MTGSDSEQKEEDQNSQVSSTFTKENWEIYTKRELKSLLERIIKAYQSTCHEK